MSAFHLGHALVARTRLPPRPAPTAVASERQDLRRGFEAERQGMVAARLGACFFAFFAGLAAVDVSEAVQYPERAAVMSWITAAEVLCAVVALALRRWWLTRPTVTSVVTFAALMTLVSLYHALSHAGADRLAIVLVVVMTAYSVVMVPTVVEQLALAGTCALGFVAVVPQLVVADGMPVPLIGVAAGAIASIMAASFMIRFFRTSYVHGRLQQEEAEIASALLRVVEQLQERLERPRMLDEVNRIAVEVLGCDWSTTYVFADEGRTMRLIASHGVQAQHMPASQLLQTSDFLGLAERAGSADGVFEIVDEDVVLTLAQGRRSIGRPSMLQALMLHDDEPIGLFGIGVERAGHAFGVRERRIVRGIAHAAAIAIRNRRLLEDVQAASRLKSDFVATMSHELRTPINVVIGYVDMLADGDGGPLSATQQALTASIRSRAVELLELVNSTLELNRLEAGQDPVRPMLFPLEDLLAEIGRELRPLAPAQVALTWDREPAVREVGTDRPKLKTILKNLVGNALKFTVRGRVEMQARADGDTLLLQVRDTGVGIRPEDLPVIFESFRQGSATASRSGGVGLGLHIVKRLVGLLGGTVDVDSAPNRGTTFTVRLPGAIPVTLPASRCA